MLNQAQHDSLKKEDDDVPYNGVVKFTLFTMTHTVHHACTFVLVQVACQQFILN